MKKVFLLMMFPLFISSGQTEPTEPVEEKRVKKGEKEFFTPRRDKKKINAQSNFVEGLPNVLLIGDSISIGYTPSVITALEGKANVFRIPRNGGNTQRGLNSIDSWLQSREEMKGAQWNVIHFNWGLHDLCYRHSESKTHGKRDKVNGTQDVPIAQYEKNLEKLVIKLKDTKAKLIWANTTFVPEGEAGRYQGDDHKYNAVAKKIMDKYSIPINDLNAFSQTIKHHASKAGDVHFTGAGSKELGKKVASEIAKQLGVTVDEAQK